MPSRALLAVVTLLLFLLWSNSFVAMSWVLGSEHAPARLDWVGLTSARYLPVTLSASLYLLLFRREQTSKVLRTHFVRGLIAGLLAVPTYSFALYWGIAQGIPAPIASLLTALSPLYLLILGALFLGEPLTRWKVGGFAVSFVGLILVAAARGGLTLQGLAPVAIAATAPLSWALQTALSKPISRQVPADVWTATYLVLGGVPLLLGLPWLGGEQVLALDLSGWAAVSYLSFGCTILGFALWSWLLVHVPASSLGFTVFLNPPLALLSQLALSRLFPGSFVFALRPGELAGCAVVLVGLGVALRRPKLVA